MARRPTRKAAGKSARGASARATSPRPASVPTSDRDKIIAALLTLLADKAFETIGLADVARHAGLSLSQLRGEFASTLGIVAAFVKATDRAVLAEDLSDMAEEPERERLFDVLMRRLETLAPHRQAIRSLLRSARRNPPLALALNRPRRALAAMDAGSSRHRFLRPPRHDPRPRAGDAVRLSAAHLDRG